MGAIALDTTAYAAFMAGHENLLEALSGAERVLVPLFVIGELHFGFRGGRPRRENVAELSRFLAKPTVSPWLPSLETAEVFGELKDRLKRADDPIPINDVWIASACLETGAKLVTYDRHFKRVEGLRLWEGAP